MTQPDNRSARSEHGGWRPNWAAVGALAAVASVVVSIVTLYPRDRSSQHPSAAGGPVSPSASTTGGAGPSPQGTHTPSPEPASSATVVLGRDRQASDTKPCGSPVVAAGAAWQIRPAQIGGRTHDTTYTCNLFAGSAGSLRFVLGRSFRALHATIGFVDGSVPGGRVKYELVGDGRVYLTPPVELTFGGAKDVDMNVADITQLEVKVTELSQPDSMGSPVNPALVLTLTKAS